MLSGGTHLPSLEEFEGCQVEGTQKTSLGFLTMIAVKKGHSCESFQEVIVGSRKNKISLREDYAS